MIVPSYPLRARALKASDSLRFLVAVDSSRQPAPNYSKTMSFSFDHCDYERGSLSNIAPLNSDSHMADDNLSEQNLSAFANPNANFNTTPISRETFHPAPFRSARDFGQFSASMIPLRPNQSYNTTPVEQALPTSLFSLSLEPGTAATNLVWDQAFDPNTGLVFPLYETSNYGQYSPNVYTNASYCNFNREPSQFSTFSTLPATICSSNQPNTTSSRPYSCSFCGKYFTRKADMQRHNGIHGPRSLQCNVQGCNKAFYRKDKLDEHMKTHQKG